MLFQPMHASLTEDRICEAVERRMTSLDNPGFCTCCGEETEGVEPDAEDYHCEACGADAVYGADELLMYIAA
jgi:Zn finger protein HypA/HybF involved in hydrogenase expression